MKIAVYDKVNKSRLLGHLETSHDLRGAYLRVAQRLSKHVWAFDLNRQNQARSFITFDIDVQRTSKSVQNNPATHTLTTVETKVLLTSETLETLMQLACFKVAGEAREEERVVYMSDYITEAAYRRL